VRDKGQGSSFQERISHTYTLKIGYSRIISYKNKNKITDDVFYYFLKYLLEMAIKMDGFESWVSYPFQSVKI